MVNISRTGIRNSLLKILLNGLFFFITTHTLAQYPLEINQELMREVWQAKWITSSVAKDQPTKVMLFRKVIDISRQEEPVIIHVSADNRYKFYVNNKLVGQGPVRGDLMKWRFETYDISTFLKEGKNCFTAQVWDMGNLAPVAQFSAYPGLIIQADDPEYHDINTNESWKVKLDTAYNFHRIDHLNAYYVVGPGESFDGALHPWGWASITFDDAQWDAAIARGSGMPLKSLGKYGGLPSHILHPSDIPVMERKEQFFSSVRRSTIDIAEREILSSIGNIVISPHQKASILLDQHYLTTAYPEVSFSGGKGSEIKLTYAESLFETEIKNGKETFTSRKGNRHEIGGKKIKGNFDIIRPDGGQNRIHESLWWRTFRYVQLDIETGNEALTLHQVKNHFTGYPLRKTSTFGTDQQVLDSIYETGWRTQRLCAGETFFDCPYYEQLQYVGDTRVQRLVTYYSAGDTLLWRKSIQDFYDSRIPSGITQSRYPCREMQLIPTYSLVWITMMYDYLLHCSDQKFIEEKMPLVDDILRWFEDHLDEDYLFGKIEGWNFMDWVSHEGWDSGIPPLQNDGQSSVILLQYLYTIQKAMVLYHHFGDHHSWHKYQKMGDAIVEAVNKNYWDDGRMMYADTPDKKYFSQHANVWAILTDALPEQDQAILFERIYIDSGIAQCSYYFDFYLADAMHKVGKGEDYLHFLEPWEKMLENGLTTFAEAPEPTRSDCHAWSSSPLYHYYKIVAGITPIAPGFDQVSIEPSFGELEYIRVSLETARGNIILDLTKREDGQPQGAIQLPEGMTGSFFWKGSKLSLKEGDNNIKGL